MENEMSLKQVGVLAGALMLAVAAPPVLAAGSSLVELKDNDTIVGGINAKVGDVTGMDVYGSDGKKIGDVDTILADTSGKAQAVVIDVGGFLGVGTREVVLPLSKLTRGPDDDRLNTALTKTEIEKLEDWKSAKAP
jgi:sporulation protein YlmC with PRC-barrel domain